MDEYLAARNAARTAGKRPAPDTDPHPQHGSSSRDNGPQVPFNVSHALITGCPICPQEDDFIRATPNPNLSRCSACKVVYYCSPAHQAADRAAHKTFCKRVQKATFIFEKEQAALKAYKGITDWRKVFETPLEDFWGYEEGRRYIKAGKEFVHELLRFNTKAAVEKALLWTLALMKLSPKDPSGLRCITPFLYIRTGRDQECYDYCKWWVTEGTHKEHAWDSEDLPLTGEDPLESAEVFERIRDYGADPPRRTDLSFLLAVLLLKIRMLSDVKFLRNHKGDDVAFKGDNFAFWSISSIVFEDIWYDREGEQYLPLIKELENQVRRLFRAVGRANKYFWHGFIEQRTHLVATPLSHGLGDEAEMQIKLQECYNAWMETRGADGYIWELMGRIDPRWFHMNQVNGHSLHLRQCEFSVQYVVL